MSNDILIVDDEADIRELVSGVLNDEGYKTRMASDGVEAMEHIRYRMPNLVILDVWLGDNSKDGMKILESIKKDHPYIPVIMISGHANIENAVNSIKIGAYDFIEKPFNSEKLLMVVKRAIESYCLEMENDDLRKKNYESDNFSLIGSSQQITSIKNFIDQISDSVNRIFISSSAGFDQEALARYIHKRSSRKNSPFAVLNCKSLQEKYLEPELFGLELPNKERKIGYIEKAHSGTLFIENITLMSNNLQNKLTKFLHNKSFSRVSGDEKHTSDVRIIAGSTEDVLQLKKDGKFSDDLFYRLSVKHIVIPPLKERISDIPDLANYYMEKISKAHGKIIRKFSNESIALLQDYYWPGDLKQFRNIIERIVFMSYENTLAPIGVEELPLEIITGNAFLTKWQKKIADLIVLPLKAAREVFEREYLTAQIQRFSGNISQTARFVGMERSALHRKLRALKINDAKKLDFSYDECENNKFEKNSEVA